MPQVLLRPSAISDLKSIAAFINADNPGRGFSFVEEIESTIRLWAENPQAGRECDEIRKGMRSFPYKNYVVFYYPLEKGIAVERVVHGSRNYRKSF